MMRSSLFPDRGPGGDELLKVRAYNVKIRGLRGAPAGAAQPVPDGFAGGLRPGDLLIKFRELALCELSPAWCAIARCHEDLLLGESEPRVTVKPDGGDDRGRRFRVAALPGDPGRCGEQAEFLVVPQGRGGDTGAAGQLADGEQSTGHIDFRCT